jgi:hypothetical protein
MLAYGSGVNFRQSFIDVDKREVGIDRGEPNRDTAIQVAEIERARRSVVGAIERFQDRFQFDLPPP